MHDVSAHGCDIPLALFYRIDGRVRHKVSLEAVADAAAEAGRTRDRLLLVVGCATGFRIRELCSLTYGQVWDASARVGVREVSIARRNLKGGRGLWQRLVRGRRVPLSEPVRSAIRDYLTKRTDWTPDPSLFAACRSGVGKAMQRSQAWRIIAGIAEECGIDTARYPRIL